MTNKRHASRRRIGSITVGGTPAPEELPRLAEEGFRTVVDLRLSDEAEQAETLPDQTEEGERARELGLEYFHLPVRRDRIEESEVERFHAAMEDLPRPAYVHCGLGGRAAAMAAIHEGVRQGLSGDEAVRRAEEAGLGLEDGELVRFVRDFVDARTR